MHCEECDKLIGPGDDYGTCDICTSLFCSEECLRKHKGEYDAETSDILRPVQ